MHGRYARCVRTKHVQLFSAVNMCSVVEPRVIEQKRNRAIKTNFIQRSVTVRSRSCMCGRG